MGRDRRQAAAPDRRYASSLSLDAAVGLGVVGGGDELLLSDPNLERERTLARFGQNLTGIEAMPDLITEPEPVEAAGGEHDGVEAPLSPLPEPRVDVSPERLDGEGRLEGEQLRASAHGRGSDPHLRLDPFGAAESVARIVAGEVGTHDQTVG